MKKSHLKMFSSYFVFWFIFLFLSLFFFKYGPNTIYFYGFYSHYTLFIIHFFFYFLYCFYCFYCFCAFVFATLVLPFLQVSLDCQRRWAIGPCHFGEMATERVDLGTRSLGRCACEGRSSARNLRIFGIMKSFKFFRLDYWFGLELISLGL